jgi:hypothetical protein
MHVREADGGTSGRHIQLVVDRVEMRTNGVTAKGKALGYLLVAESLGEQV